MAVQNSIIVVNHNDAGSLKNMLKALEIEQALTSEVIVVDNGSTDDSREMVRRTFPQVRVLSMGGNVGFAAAANRGLFEAAGDVAIFCHSDIIASAHTLTELADRVRHGSANRTAAALPRLMSRDKMAQPFIGRLPGVGLGTLGVFNPPAARKVEEPSLDHVPDHQYALLVCAAFDCDLLHKIGGFDERFFRYYHDADVCQRLHDRSYRIVIHRDLVVIHMGDEQRDAPPHLQRLMRLDQHRFFAKHRPAWERGVLQLDEKVLRLIWKDAV